MTTSGRTRLAPEPLSRRQQEVLELLRRDFTNEQIAQRLGVSLDGAKWHVSEIIGRLGVADRHEAARWRPEGAPRPWWSLAWLRDLRWSTAAKATSVAALVVVSVAVIAFGWGVRRTNKDAAPGPRTMIAFAGDGAIAVDTETGGVVPRFSELGGLEPVVSPDGTRAAYSCGDDAVPYRGARNRALCISDPVAGATVLVSSSELPPDGFSIVTAENFRPQIAWSADASKIAFVVYQPTAADGRITGDLYMKDLVSGDLRLLDRGDLTSFRIALRWSPDGGHVSMLILTPLYSADSDGSEVGRRLDLRLIDVTSGQRNDVSVSSNTGQQDNVYAWAPDSRTIVVTGQQSLYVVDVTAAAANPQRIGGAWGGHDAVWSPDGAWIAATELVGDQLHVFITRADGSERHRIDGGMTISLYPAWSPDSRYIAFAGAPGAPGDLRIYVAGTSRGTPREVADASPLDSFQRRNGLLDRAIIAWSADGERVLYSTPADGCADVDCPPGYLRMVNADGSGAPRQLHDLPVSEILGWTE